MWAAASAEHRPLSRAWIGLLFLLANALLLQELVRFMIEVIDSVSRGSPLTGGWLDLSTGAAPATWLYWISHIWVLTLFMRQRRDTGVARLRGAEYILGIMVAVEIVAIHYLALTFRTDWIVTPRYLW